MYRVIRPCMVIIFLVLTLGYVCLYDDIGWCNEFNVLSINWQLHLAPVVISAKKTLHLD